MKKIYSLVLLFPMLAAGQQPNYVKTTAYKQATAASIPNPQPEQATQQATYLDGLGRPIQQAALRQSATGKDIVTHIEYDGLGRQTRDYLPYASASSGAGYDANALSETLSFYNTPAYENTQNPYSEKLFEASPMNRVLKQATPGNSWKMPQAGESDHTVRTEYDTNSDNYDYVAKYIATASWNPSSKIYDVTIVQNGRYSASQLYKTTVKDENWKLYGNESSTVEFRNKQGQIIAKFSGGYPTYYVYDQFDNLSFVIPPNTNGSLAQADLDKFCYQYKYDSRNRLAAKKIPGKQWEYLVYDRLDRVVASGPVFAPFANLINSGTLGWTVTKYDVFGRAVLTGWMPENGKTRQALQTEADAYVQMNEQRNSGSTVSGISFKYTTQAFPASGYHVLAVNYFDDYAFPNAPASFGPVEGQTVYYNATRKPKGLATGSWTRVLESSTDLAGEHSYVLYDHKAHPIKTRKQNYLGGYTDTESRLDFSGKTLYSITRHKRDANAVETKVREDFSYSAQDRLLAHHHQINDGETELLALNTYDEMGQLSVKKTGNTTQAPLQKIDFTYNVRGWLKGINAHAANLNMPLDTGENDLFAFKIHYDMVTKSENHNVVKEEADIYRNLYNGNISETFWKTATDNILRKYEYFYDNLNRLTEARYSKPNEAVPYTGNYNEQAIYDAAGNIHFMGRHGGNDTAGEAMPIDWLLYEYDGNQVKKIIDYSLSPQGFADDSNGIEDPEDDYAYDDNGNMVSDTNKGITSITYNHLNLPVEIVFNGSNRTRISYLYDALGNKKKKTVRYVQLKKLTEIDMTNSTDYLDGFQYLDGTQEFFPTTDGYVRPVLGTTGYSYMYVHNYTDHLGNVRLSYADANKDGAIDPLTEILEENNYYPFGLKHEGYNNGYAYGNKYKYNGKEYQDELGLNFYDYGARNYDPAIGRWMNIDPHAYNYPWASPYNYAFNNPTLVIDPDGKDGVVTGSGTKDDPFIVTANYYYYGLSSKQSDGLINAVSAYNNDGKSRSFKDGNGNETFVVMNLTAIEVANEDVANDRAFSDVVDTGNINARFGNVVTTSGESSDGHFGRSSSSLVTLNQDKITSTLKSFRGGNEDSLIKGTFIHELGHNLGASHGDPGNIMNIISVNEQNNNNVVVGGGSGNYNYKYPSVNGDGVRAFMGRVNSPGSISSYYLTSKENKKVASTPNNGAPGTITNIN